MVSHHGWGATRESSLVARAVLVAVSLVASRLAICTRHPKRPSSNLKVRHPPQTWLYRPDR